MSAIKVREERCAAIARELQTLALSTPGDKNAHEIRAALRQYLADWTSMARTAVPEARRLFRTVLVDRIVFRPIPRPPHLPPVKGPGRRARMVYAFEGEATVSKLFANLIPVSLMVAPTGRDLTYRIQVRDFIAR